MSLTWVIEIALVAGAVMVLAPAAFLLVEIVAAALPGRPLRLKLAERPPVAVLMPAHDEAAVIGDTLAAVRSELAPGDRLLVVADNCSDDTARLAAAAGAEVAVRRKLEERGKGYALAFGIERLKRDPRPVVIVIDADCKPAPGALGLLAQRCAAAERVIQARYDLHLPGEPTPYLALALFAWRLKTALRAIGLARLGGAAHLAGTGMAFPWEIASEADFGGGELVEDLVLGLTLARSGRPAEFFPDARVSSVFPVSVEGQQTQRSRWETGHLNVIARHAPAVFLAALRRRDWPAFALACDAAVPPLAFLALSIAGMLFAALIFAMVAGATAPLALTLAAGVCFAAAVVLAWFEVGRADVSAATLLKAPAYALAKLGLYRRVLTRERLSWTRSKRD